VKILLVLIGLVSLVLYFGIRDSPSYVEAKVPMRDGAQLLTRIHRVDDEPRPVILTRTYTASYPQDQIDKFLSAGFHYVVQRTRSKDPNGRLTRFHYDGTDGYDCLEWIKNQPWSNGKIGMFGRSFAAMTQWLVAALNPHRTALFNVSSYGVNSSTPKSLLPAYVLPCPDREIKTRLSAERDGIRSIFSYCSSAAPA